MDNPWNGGGGYTQEEVANMTLDGIWSRLCDPKMLQREVGKRTEKMPAAGAMSQVVQKDGSLKGVSGTGEEIRLKSSPKSKAAMLREGTYTGWVTNDSTGEKEYLGPKKKETKRQRRIRERNERIEKRRLKEQKNGS